MNYQEALDYIHGIYKFGSKLGLENINELLGLMGNPHKNLKVIHVAGTNGKGSTSSYIHSVLVAQGYKVGLYTSPYLEEFTERIRINHQHISKSELAEITEFVREKVEEMLSHGKNHPTEFEVVTAIGFEYFKREQVDYVVLEVGLGGRGDSTNVVDAPLVSVITPIDFDHMDYLGNTLKDIAYEKAGIIKKGCPVVSYPQQREALAVIEEVCQKQGAKLKIAPIHTIEMKRYDKYGQSFDVNYREDRLEDISISMLGEHQAQNATVALAVFEVLQDVHGIEIAQGAINEGLKSAIWPGRMEILSTNPLVMIDGAHNVHGMNALAEAVERLFADQRMILVMGILGDKDVTGMLSKIIPLADQIILTKPNNPRAMSLDRLKGLIKDYGKDAMTEEEIPKAVKRAIEMATAEDLILFCGSLYMIGEVRSLLKTKS